MPQSDPSGFADLSVLIIEANSKDAEFLKASLEARSRVGLHAFLSDSPESATAQSHTLAPGILLAAFNFFEGNPDRFKSLRNAFPGVPCLALLSESDQGAGAMTMGFSGYISKTGFDPDVVIQLMAGIASLEHEARRYRQLDQSKDVVVKSVSEGILEVDKTGRVTFINSAASRMLGRHPQEVVGRPLNSVLSFHEKKPESPAAADKLMEPLTKGERVSADQVTFSDKNGNPFTVNYILHPVFESSRLLGMIVFFREISDQIKVGEKLKDAIQEQLQNEQKLVEALTALKNLNERLRETQDQLIQAEKMQSVGRLAAGVAHEVKNPLAILLQGAEYLEQSTGGINPDILPVIKDMIDAVRRADAVIKGLLDFAAPVEPSMTEEDIHQVLEECLHLVTHLLRKNQIKVIRHFDSGLGPLTADKNRLMQIFINLLSNAVYAMPSGGELILTTSRMPKGSREPYRMVIEIEDSGTGIPEELLDKVFEPFVTTRRGRGGTGLGLPVVKSIVEMHHGDIQLKNREKGGTHVILRF